MPRVYEFGRVTFYKPKGGYGAVLLDSGEYVSIQRPNIRAVQKDSHRIGELVLQEEGMTSSVPIPGQLVMFRRRIASPPSAMAFRWGIVDESMQRHIAKKAAGH